MTLATMLFKARKERGYIKKVGKGRFMDGNTEHERVLWRDAEMGAEYVIYNGEACPFKRWRRQEQCADYIIGRI